MALFLQLEDHPDLAYVEYIAVWHAFDGEGETKVRWKPGELKDGSRGFTLSSDEAQALLNRMATAEKPSVRTTLTKVTFDVVKNREILSGLVDQCSKS
ncbi:MAG TPA: hypothetical protein VK862_10345 [Afifellaceae bacterium]|nr:hypothetical protein [Afifellaceae bacterium]